MLFYDTAGSWLRTFRHAPVVLPVGLDGCTGGVFTEPHLVHMYVLCTRGVRQPVAPWPGERQLAAPGDQEDARYS